MWQKPKTLDDTFLATMIRITIWVTAMSIDRYYTPLIKISRNQWRRPQCQSHRISCLLPTRCHTSCVGPGLRVSLRLLLVPKSSLTPHPRRCWTLSAGHRSNRNQGSCHETGEGACGGKRQDQSQIHEQLRNQVGSCFPAGNRKGDRSRFATTA